MDQLSPGLDALGVQYGADKSSLDHDYLSFYERFLQPLRLKPLKILEIGVFEGASLKVWEDYFPNASIVGADINPAVRRFARARVKIEIVDQSNLQNLVDLAVKHGPFDLIVEDGSHLWEHQITTLRTLFPFVRNGGLYIVEDLQTNYGALSANYRAGADQSCMEYLKSLVDLRVGDDQIDIGGVQDAFARTYGRAMAFMAFARHCCVIGKSLPDIVGQHDFGQPLQQLDDEPSWLPLVLKAHVGHEGDQINPRGWLNRIDAKHTHNIQGFTLDGEGDAANAVQYRARLHDGVWTDWARLGLYVGTKEQAQDLSGFEIRLAEPYRRAFSVTASASFRAAGQRLETVSGETCVSTLPTGRMCAMQVGLRKLKIA